MTNSKKLFKNNFTDLVRKRYSCRTFDKREINDTEINKIIDLLKNKKSLFGNPIGLKLVHKKQLKKENFFTTGTYGMIKGVNTFLAGIMTKNSPKNWEDFGYCLERAVISATDLDLNTCWIGGVFDRKTFKKLLNLEENEIIPAVIALGYEARKRVLRDKIVRWGAKGDLRKTPKKLFFLNSFSEPIHYHPLSEEKSSYTDSSSQIIPEIIDILENIRLAPSASNKQPWRILVEHPIQNQPGNFENEFTYVFHFYLCRDKLYRKLTPRVDLQRIDMGIALFHFEQSVFEKSLKLNQIENEPKISNLPVNHEYICSHAIGAGLAPAQRQKTGLPVTGSL